MALRIKQFEVKNKGGKAKIRLLGDISWWNNGSDEFTRLIDNLLSEGIEDVDAYINSPGGDMFIGNELRNQFARFPGHKYVKLGALCASAATTITPAFDLIECVRNTSYMIHDPLFSPFIEHEEDFESNKKLYQNLRNNAIGEYVSLSKRIKGEGKGLSAEEVSEMMRKTTWMNAEELLEKGFVHKIANEDDSYMPEDAQDVANRMKFTLPKAILNKLQNSIDPDEGQDDDPPAPKPKPKNQSTMKNFILTFLATFNVVNVNEQSSEGDIFNSLKAFVNQKVTALNNVLDHLKTYEGFQFNAENVVQSIKDFVKLKDDKIQELQDKVDKIDQDQREAIFDIARNQKGYTDEQIKALKEMSNHSTVESLVKFVEQSKNVKSLANEVSGEGASNSSTMAHAINARVAGIKNDLLNSKK